jgi:pimeloyl-ACP methyl ester carboxylesterase
MRRIDNDVVAGGRGVRCDFSVIFSTVSFSMDPAIAKPSLDAVIRVGSIDVAFTDTGGPGRPLLLVHGFLGSRDDWADVVAPLAERTGRIITYDLRGHGASAKLRRRSAYDLAPLVEDLLGLLDALEVTECDAVGHSFGGLVVARAAALQPSRFGSLVLMCTPARPMTDHRSFAACRSFRARVGVVRRTLESQVLGAMALAGGMRTVAPSIVRGTRHAPQAVLAARDAMGAALYDRRTYDKVSAVDSRAFLAIRRYLTRFPSIEPELRCLRCPTMVMTGEQDEWFVSLALEVHQLLAEAGNAADLVVVADAAHSPQVENPKAWIEAIATHVESARG